MQEPTTLRAWYDDVFVALFHADADVRTLYEYRGTLNVWERLTTNPTYDQVTNVDLALFRAKVKDSGLAAATVNKHMRHLNHLFAKLGPPGPRNRDALSLLDVAPWAKQLRAPRRTKSATDFESVALFHRACPDAWWRAFVVAAYNTASRKTALFALSDSDVDYGRRRLRFRAEFDKRRIERTKPLSSTLSHFLRALRPECLSDVKVRQRRFYDVWHEIAEKASLTPEQFFTPHDLKRLALTQLAAIASPWAVRYMGDHAQADVTGLYVDPLPELEAVIEKLPQPDWAPPSTSKGDAHDLMEKSAAPNRIS